MVMSRVQEEMDRYGLKGIKLWASTINRIPLNTMVKVNLYLAEHVKEYLELRT